MRKPHSANCGLLRFNNRQPLCGCLGPLSLVLLLVFMSPLCAADETPAKPVKSVQEAPLLLADSLRSDTLAESQDSPTVHRVMPGDTLWSIAEDHFGNTQQWSLIRDINAIQDPSQLRPGMLVDLEKKDAFPVSVHYLFGQAWQVEGDNKQMLEQGQMIHEGASLETGRGASLTLETSDGSRVVVPSNTRVMLKRESKLGIRLVLDKGEVDSRIIPRDNKNRPFNIKTDSGVLGVRGTRFIAEAARQATLSSVYEGSVAAQSAQQGGERGRISSGEGARAGNDGSLEVVDLLPAPEVRDAQSMLDGKFVVTFGPSDSAHGYQATVSRDAEGLENIVTKRTTSSRLVLDDLAEGDYFLRLAAIDALGIVGEYRQQAIEHRPQGVSLTNTGDTWRINWRRQSSDRHALEMATQPSFNKVMLRYQPSSTDAVVLQGLPEERLFWRVVRLDDAGNVASVLDSGLIDETR